MPYIGKKPENIIATAVDSTTGTFSGAVSAASVDADGGVTVDNITIDGQEIDVSSGDLTLDVAGDIILDADGGEIIIKDGGTENNRFIIGGNDAILKSSISDGDMIFKGNDGGSEITALTLDMSAAGAASFNGAVTANAGVVVDNITIDGTEIDLSSGDLTVDVAGDLILDVDGGDVHFQDAGSSNRFMSIKNSSGSAVFSNPFADGDITFQGNDNGVGVVTPLTLDMSTGGTATFAKNVTITDGNLVVASGHGIDFSATANTSITNASMSSELLDDYEEGTWTPVVSGSSSGIYSLDSGFKARYTKIGAVCHVSATFGLDSLSGSASGYTAISGFPFNYNGGLSQAVSTVACNNVNLSSSCIQLVIAQASSGTSNSFFLTQIRDNTTSESLDLSSLSSSSDFTFSVTYQVA